MPELWSLAGQRGGTAVTSESPLELGRQAQPLLASQGQGNPNRGPSTLSTSEGLSPSLQQPPGH